MMYLAALTALVTAGGVGLLSVVLKNRWPGKNKIKPALQALKKDTELIAGELVPLEEEEMEVFSSRQEKQTLKKGMMIIAKGVFTTIFHEPVLAYSYKKYMGGDTRNNALLYIKTANNEFTYWLQKKGVEVFINGQKVGIVTEDNKLYGVKTKKVLAQIGAESNGLKPVLIYDKEVGSLSQKQAKGSKDPSPRAFEFLKDNLSKEEKLLFLAMSGFALVMNSIEA